MLAMTKSSKKNITIIRPCRGRTMLAMTKSLQNKYHYSDLVEVVLHYSHDVYL